MDLLKDLIAHATGSELPAGDQRIALILDKLRAAGDVDLAALEHAGQAHFEDLYAGGEYDPANVPTIEAVADVIAATRVLIAEHNAAKIARDQQVTALADRVRTPPADPVASAQDGSTTGDNGQQPQQPEQAQQVPPAPAEQAPLPPAVPAVGGGDGGETAPPPAGQAQPQDPDQPVTPPPGEPVAAGAGAPARRTSTTAALAGRNAPVPATTPAPGALVKPLRSFSITASAEIPEYPFGQAMTLEQLADAAATRFATLPVGQEAAGPIKANVARVNRHFAPEITLKGEHSDIALLDHLADETRLPGGSLVAAARYRRKHSLTAAADGVAGIPGQAPSIINDVWCTPSETDFTLCPPLATVDGLIDIPSTGMPSRGGIRYPRWSQYPEQELDTARNGWHGNVIVYPEPPAAAPGPGKGLDNPGFFRPNGTPPDGVNGGLGNVKKCIEGPCVEWREVRQSLSYLCITSDVLRDRTFPEGLQRFMSDVLVHQAHYLNGTYIDYIRSHSDPVPPFSVANGPGSLGSTALTATDRLALLVTWFRGRYKMAKSATLEIVAPEWFSEFLKRDIEKKSNRPYGAVSDAEVEELFATYASRVQWVKDWQEIGDGAAVNGNIMPPADWPNKVELMAYPAGSWVLSVGNVLTLGVLYDFQLLMQNRYSAMFVEDAWMLLNRCNRTFTVTLTDLCANGAVGPRRDACPKPVPGSAEATPLFTRAITATPAAAEAQQADTPDGGDTPPAPTDQPPADTTKASNTANTGTGDDQPPTTPPASGRGGVKK